VRIHVGGIVRNILWGEKRRMAAVKGKGNQQRTLYKAAN